MSRARYTGSTNHVILSLACCAFWGFAAACVGQDGALAGNGPVLPGLESAAAPADSSPDRSEVSTGVEAAPAEVNPPLAELRDLPGVDGPVSTDADDFEPQEPEAPESTVDTERFEAPDAESLGQALSGEAQVDETEAGEAEAGGEEVGEGTSDVGEPNVDGPVDSDREPPADARPSEPAVAPQPRPELSPEMAAFRDRVRKVLAAHRARSFSTASSTPAQVIAYCFAYGVTAEIAHPQTASSSQAARTRQAQPVNAIGALCWNFPFGESRLFRVGAAERRVVPRVGLEYQDTPGQFLAMLAMTRVPQNYEIRCNEVHTTIADLVKFEKATCYEGDDLSFKLIGLSFYVDPREEWENSIGETWSLERLVEAELARVIPNDDRRLVIQLLALSCAVESWRAADLPVEGTIERTRDYIEQYWDFALALQNDDGSWNPALFAARGKSTDADASLMSSGQILRWLVATLPDQRLSDPRVIRSVGYVATVLGRKSPREAASRMSRQELEAIMAAAHALAIYDHRYFRRFDAPLPPPENASETAQDRVSQADAQAGAM